VTSACATRRPPLRLHRPGGDAALDRVAVGVCREFDDADALALLRSARQLGRLALDGGEPDAAAATLVLVQLAIDRLEADAERSLDGLVETLDSTHSYYRAALRAVIRHDDRKKYAVKRRIDT
jgi:hypothetical protein